MKRALPFLVALVTGVIILADFLITNPLLDALGNMLLDWAVFIAGFAFIVGLLNVLVVHFARVFKRERGWPYSIVLVLAMWLVIIFGVLDPQGPQGAIVNWIFRYVQYPLQATLFALLAFFGLSAGYRAFRRRTAEATIMLTTASLVLLGQAMLISDWGKWLAAVKDWILSVPAVAGMRGILIGVALGVIATGIRVLIGLDKPYAD